MVGREKEEKKNERSARMNKRKVMDREGRKEWVGGVRKRERGGE